MFDSGYTYQYAGKRSASYKQHVYTKHIYKFQSAKRAYVIWVEEHNYKTYIIKFFAKKHERSKLKFNTLVGDYDATRTIATCIDVMLEILDQNETASFAFVGAHTFKKRWPAEKGNISQRFSIYRTLMANKFGVLHFQHIEVVEKNAYLMCNLKNKPSINKKVISNMIACYPGLDTI